jgi:predicted permease
MWANVTAIFSQVLLPVLIATGLGALVQWRFKLHVPTLSRLNIWLLVPCFLFVKVYESTVSVRDLGWIALAVVIPGVVLGVPLFVGLRRARVQGGVVAAVVVGGLFYNAGNFGLPVAELLYSVQQVRFPGMGDATDGPAVQALLMMVSSLCIWGLGYVILAAAKGEGWRGVWGYFKLPMLYVLIAAFVFRESGVQPWTPVFNAMRIVGDACVPVMLLILGMQLAQDARWPRWRVVSVAAVVKLLILPAVTWATVWALGMWPWPGAQLVIAAAAPTAVNTLLLTLELEGDANLAADVVFWTTILSAVTVTAVIVLVVMTGGA